MLKEAGAEHGKALMVNTASIAGKHGQGWLSAYSATKFGVVGLSQGLHKELSGDGIQVTAFAGGQPGFAADGGHGASFPTARIARIELIGPFAVLTLRLSRADAGAHQPRE